MKRVVYAVSGALVLLALVLTALRFREPRSIEAFHATRPIVRDLHKAIITQRPTNRVDAQIAFDRRFHVGTDRFYIVGQLEAEGFRCHPSPETQKGSVCHLQDRTETFPWHIEVHFDDDDRLLSSRVLALKTHAG